MAGIKFDSIPAGGAFEKDARSVAEHVNDLSSKISDIEKQQAVAYLKVFEKNAVVFFEKLTEYYEKCKNELLDYQSQLDLVKGGYWKKRKVKKEIKSAIQDYTERQKLLTDDIRKIKDVG